MKTKTIKLTTLKGASLALLLGFTSGAQAQDAKSPQWTDLYNGKNLDGWVQRGDPATVWRAEDETIVGRTDAKAKAHGYLCTEKEYGDFILEVDFKVDPDYRAGIQIRSMSYPEYYGGVVHGDQVVIAPKATSGGIMEEAGRHWLYDLKGNDTILKTYRSNDWNHFTIACVGDTIKTWLNGVEGSNLRDAKTPIGFIAFEVNRGNTNNLKLEARFKNIRILSLDQAAPAIKTYVEIQELSPTDQKSWVAPILKQPENKPDAGSATVFKHPPKPPENPPPASPK